MIFRRPYAFLIRHFRSIHMILFFLMSYITYNANAILSFFKEYLIRNGNMIIDSTIYINYFVFVSIFLIVCFSSFIYFLMRYKKKPKTLYILLIVISVFSCFVYVYLCNTIRVLETSIESTRTIRIYRDISRFNFYILFVSCIPIFIRGIGFDIKKFNFNSDLHELNLEDKDSEEVEVNTNLSSDGIKRTGRRIIRELKYYYVENKIFINIILGIVGIIMFFMFPFNYFVVNRNLNEGEFFGTNYFNFRVNDSYVSDRNRISKNNSYLILKIELKGKTNKYKLDLDEFVLEGKNNKYIPSTKYYYYFSDLGNGYRNTVLDTENYKEYLLIYNIKNEDLDSNFVLNYIVNDKKVNIKPEYLN